MNNGNFSPSLFDEQKNISEIQIREDERRRLLEDPTFVIQAYQKRLESLEGQLVIYKPKAELYEGLIGSINGKDCGSMSNLLDLYYINPQGKKTKIGPDYIIQVFVYDKIIFKNYSGYNLYAAHKEHGETVPSTRNGYCFDSVVFNSKGVDYLLRKYRDDKRIWRAINRKLVCESEIN